MVVDLDESRNSEWKQQRVPLLRDEAPRPSYTSMLGSILCNTFFFFSWKEHSMNFPSMQTALSSSGW